MSEETKIGRRLKELRKTLGLTQQEIADKLGIKRNSFANYEIGRNTPLDTIIKSICREYHVREDWLRTGEGNMFSSDDRENQIATAINSLVGLAEDNDFKARFISMLSELSEKEWGLLEDMIKTLVPKE